MQIFGWLGFVTMQIFFVPQTMKILRTRDVSGLSLPAWVLLWLGFAFYVTYSVAVNDVVFIVGNAMALLQTSLQIGLILKYRGRDASGGPRSVVAGVDGLGENGRDKARPSGG